MTREEAIDIVKCLAWHDLRPSEEDIEQAIKALEQEPKPMVEIDLYSVIKQIYIEREVLDKIRAEIANHCGVNTDYCDSCRFCTDSIEVREILKIIDKYKAETEEI